jgi:hypothetical protein
MAGPIKPPPIIRPLPMIAVFTASAITIVFA